MIAGFGKGERQRQSNYWLTVVSMSSDCSSQTGGGTESLRGAPWGAEAESGGSARDLCWLRGGEILAHPCSQMVSEGRELHMELDWPSSFGCSCTPFLLTPLKWGPWFICCSGASWDLPCFVFFQFSLWNEPCKLREPSFLCKTLWNEIFFGVFTEVTFELAIEIKSSKPRWEIIIIIIKTKICM